MQAHFNLSTFSPRTRKCITSAYSRLCQTVLSVSIQDFMHTKNTKMHTRLYSKYSKITNCQLCLFLLIFGNTLLGKKTVSYYFLMLWVNSFKANKKRALISGSYLIQSGTYAEYNQYLIHFEENSIFATHAINR